MSAVKNRPGDIYKKEKGTAAEKNLIYFKEVSY